MQEHNSPAVATPQKPEAIADSHYVDEGLQVPVFQKRQRGRLRRNKRRPYHPAGQGLFEIRIRQGLTLKDVESASLRLAETMQNPDYHISSGRLSQIENAGTTIPSIYKLDSLSRIYRVSYANLLRLFGIRVNDVDDEQLPPLVTADL